MFHELNDSNLLPFDEEKQHALLGHLLTTDRFFLQAKDVIKKEWFLNPFSGVAWDLKLKLYKDLNRIPTHEEYLHCKYFMEEDPSRRGRLHGIITQALVVKEQIHLDAIVPELTAWLHARLLINAVKKSADLYNGKHLADAIEEINGAVKNIKEITFDSGKEIVWSNFKQFLDKQILQKKECIAFGLTAVDKLLNPDAEKGCMMLGDTTILLAPTNIGKTTCLITVARHNVLRETPIPTLFLTHEDSPENITEKILCCMLGCTKQELYKRYQNPDQKFLNAIDYLENYFTYLPINEAGLTVEKVANIIRRKNDEWAAKHGGEGYKLVIDDYPAKLTTNLASKGNLNKRHIDEYVYNYFVQLALELNHHSLSAIQANREGSKTNSKKKDEDRLLDKEDVAESWGPMTLANNIITLNRDPVAAARHRLTYYISKSRSGETGYAIACTTDFARATTHADYLGATWYRGSTTMSDKIDDLLRQFKNKQIPPTEIVKKIKSEL